MIFERVLETIKNNKDLAEKGKYMGVPYPYSRLKEYVSSIDRGESIGILGPTGSGKSKWTRYTFLYQPYKFHVETGYKLKIIYFCMEDNKEKVFLNIICNYLYEKHNIVISIKELTSKDRILPDFILEKIEEAKDYFRDFEKVVTVIDGESEPDRIYEICQGIAGKLGYEETYTEKIEGEEIEQERYISDTHVIAIFDNLSNVDGDDEVGEQAAKLKFAKDYVRNKLCNFYRWTCLTVLQLDFESEKQNFTRSGESILGKIEPGLHSIGDSKRSARTFHLVFSLFAPARYDLIHYPQPNKHNPDNVYRIDILGNRFRALRIIKSNDSDVGLRVGLMFDALGENFKELPLPKTPEIEKIYKSLTTNSQKNFEKPKESLNFADNYKIEPDEDLPF